MRKNCRNLVLAVRLVLNLSSSLLICFSRLIFSVSPSILILILKSKNFKNQELICCRKNLKFENWKKLNSALSRSSCWPARRILPQFYFWIFEKIIFLKIISKFCGFVIRENFKNWEIWRNLANKFEILENEKITDHTFRILVLLYQLKFWFQQILN